MNIIDLTAVEIVAKIKNKEVLAVDVTKAYLKRIDALNPELNAYVNVYAEEALKQAQAVDDKIAKGQDVGLLAGVPIALKDNICYAHHPATCSSRMLNGAEAQYRSPYNAHVVEKLLAEDVVILGSSNMDEFAMGSSTENSYYGVTKNPWDQNCVPGGSSGGSAAIVAAKLAAVALGSDTGGSIRQPASFCGVVGLKPIYGEVSRYGLIAFASSLDQIGPLTHTVEDSALVMQVIGGHDGRDATSLNMPSLYDHYQSDVKDSVKGFKIGVPEECFSEGVDPQVLENLEESCERLRSLGATVEKVSLPHTKYAVSVYYIIATAEASSNLARFDGVQYGHRTSEPNDLAHLYHSTRDEGFGEEVKRRILLGTYVLSSGYYDAYYKKAQRVRTLIKRDYTRIFKEQGFDAIVMPTAPSPAFKMGEKTADPLEMYLSDIFTISVNLAGIPAISLPSGVSKEGLPFGLQFVTDADPEVGLQKLLQVSNTFEQHTKMPACPLS